MLYDIIFSRMFYIFLYVLYLMTIIVTILCEMTDVWLSDVITNPNPKF